MLPNTDEIDTKDFFIIFNAINDYPEIIEKFQ